MVLAIMSLHPVLDAAPDSTPLAGRPFAKKYVVERVLGTGGMGTVFEARHARLGSRVAIKVLGASLCEYPELVTRFEREARAAGALSSPHAVKVIDIDVDEASTPYIVMELLAGNDLARILDRDGPQPVDRSVRWLLEACHALAEAHELGIVHRDIKPSNLFLANVAGRSMVKLLDFGIAKLATQKDASITAAAPLGTPQYMSPEQVRCAKDVDARTDIWSLGVSLYELVTGEPPYPHECPSACIAAIAADPVPDPRTTRPDLPEAFVAVLMKALDKNPEARWQSVRELVDALAPFAGDDDFVRVITPMPSLSPLLPATLGDDVSLATPAFAPMPPVAVSPMLALEVPPVSHTRRAHKPRPAGRPILALAGGAALFLAAMVGAPTITKSAPSAEAAASPPPPSTEVVAPTTVSAPAAPAAPEPVAIAAPAAEEPVVDAGQPDALPPAVVTSARPILRNREHAVRDVRAMLNESPKPQAPVLTASRRAVHGGLSGPGF